MPSPPGKLPSGSALPPERLQPCLLDRLIDDHPDVRNDEGRTAGGGRGVSMLRYREGVLRDLRWLLNTKCHLPSEIIQEFHWAARSVFNYGMPDPAGRVVSNKTVAELEEQLREAILRFEPRILPHSLEVRTLTAEEMNKGDIPNAVGFEINGDLWAAPLPEPFRVKTQIDLESGDCVF